MYLCICNPNFVLRVYGPGHFCFVLIITHVLCRFDFFSCWGQCMLTFGAFSCSRRTFICSSAATNTLFRILDLSSFAVIMGMAWRCVMMSTSDSSTMRSFSNPNTPSASRNGTASCRPCTPSSRTMSPSMLGQSQ